MTTQHMKKAAALQYDPAIDDVPHLTAFGQGYVAERIIDAATQADVPIVHDAALANMLGQMNIGDEIAPELYAVVAQILLFLSESDHAYGEKMKNSNTKK